MPVSWEASASISAKPPPPPRPPIPPPEMVCHDMAVLLLTMALMAATAAAAEFHLLPGAVAFVALVATALFWRGIQSRSRGFLFGRRPAEGELLRATGTAYSASRSPLPHFTVLCISMGVVLHQPLVAAAKQHLHPAAVACAVITFATLVNWTALSLNFSVAGGRSALTAAALAAVMRLRSPNSLTAPDAERKESHAAATPPPPPVAAAQSPRAAAIALRPHQSRLARAAFVVLSALMSASWFLDPVAAAAAELRLPRPAIVGTLVVFAMCFCTSVHVFRSFFLPRAPAAAAPQWEGIAAIAAVGVGVAACLVAAGGCAYEYTTPVRI